MTDTCPPDGELERLLTGEISAAEGQALEAHVAGCAACQQRLGELNRARFPLLAWPANCEDSPRHPGTLGQITTLLPSPAPLTEQRNAPERESEATGQPTPAPGKAGDSTPLDHAAASERPTVRPAREGKWRPQPAGDPPSA